MIAHACTMFTDDVRLSAGVDEAGRGPLAGPVIAAAVVLDKDQPIQGLADSKKLTATRREVLAEAIYVRAVAVAVGRAEVEEIDSINILQATLQAMTRAIDALGVLPDVVLIDGNQAPRIALPAQCVINGDVLVPEISAASIIAKVVRDNEMLELDSMYPGYGFARHKGYPTKEHLSALSSIGPCPAHRQSFGPVKSLLERGIG